MTKTEIARAFAQRKPGRCHNAVGFVVEGTK